MVRFDLPQKALEHIQGRGRARAEGSRLLLMLERDNAEDAERMVDIQRCVGEAWLLRASCACWKGPVSSQQSAWPRTCSLCSV